MVRYTILHYYPQRLLWIGSFLLGFILLASCPLIWVEQIEVGSVALRQKRMGKEGEAYQFSLGLPESLPLMQTPDMQGQMSFSFDPPRPDGAGLGKRVLVRIKQSGESKRVILPCRLDLEFQKDQLAFAKGPSLFWMELALDANGQIQGRSWIEGVDGEKIDAGVFTASGLDLPFQSAQEFAEGSPFRTLAEAKWWGRDQFRKWEEAGERIEAGGALLELREGDWLVWKEGKWEKSETIEKEAPIARLESVSSKALVLQGWDADGHTRLLLHAAIGPPFKVKAEELFSSVRIRSEKQISCMLEKQCLVLKVGDWVLKTGGRWKVLRKKEEQDAFLNGKLFGELFILDQILQKQGQKMIQGRLFNPGRTQMLAIEMGAQSARKSLDKGRRNGRLK